MLARVCLLESLCSHARPQDDGRTWDLSYDPVGQQNAWEWDRDRSRPKYPDPVLGDPKTAEKVQKYRHGGGGGNYRA